MARLPPSLLEIIDSIENIDSIDFFEKSVRRLLLTAALCLLLAAPALAWVDVRVVGRDVFVARGEEPARLGELLGAFQRVGVAVEVDPELLGLQGRFGRRVFGDAGAVLEQLLGELNYLITWRQVPSPAGVLVTLKGIRIYREDPGTARPLAVQTGPVRTLGPKGREYVAEDVLVGLRHGTTPEQLRNLLLGIGGTLVSCDQKTGTILIRLPEGSDAARLLDGLRGNPVVAAAGLNWIYERNRERTTRTTARANVPESAPRLPALETPQAVAVLDQAMGPAATAHLAERTLSNATTVPAGFPLTADGTETHGSMMALIASGDESVHANVPLAELPLVSVGIFDDEGRTTTYAVVAGLAEAAKNGASVVNLSWGTETESAFLDSALEQAWQSGMVVVAAAGNDGKELDRYYPASAPNVLAVGATAADGSLEPYSNRGAFVDVLAPGTAIVGDLIVQGTSVSSALVSAQIAAWRSEHPDATPAEAIQAFVAKEEKTP